MRVLVSYFLLSSFSFSSWGQTCSTIDLSAPGKVLHPLTASHQNGLGICHIEQLQRLLKAELKGHPELARVSMAMREKASRDKDKVNKKAVRWKGSDGKVGGLYFDAGGACQAYQELKGQNICPVKGDRLEKLSQKNPNVQIEILSKLASFLDQDGKSLFAHINQADFLESIEKEYARALKACPIPSNIEKDFLKNYQRVTLLKVDPQVLAKRDVASYLSLNRYQYLQKFLPGMATVKNDLLFNQAARNYHSALMKQDQCVENKILVDKNPQCALFKPAFADILSLKAMGLGVKDFYQIIAQAKDDRDEFFADFMKCSGNKIKIPENLKCTDNNLVYLYGRAAHNEAYVSDVSARLSRALEKNKPVGISVCTRFFKNPGITTYNDKKFFSCGLKSDANFKAGEASHAVTVIGKRCRAGKTEFLIHNSWGKGCGYYAKEFECNKAGGFWVDAKTLANNSRSISYFE